jgi:hypothetical protein
MIFYLADGIFLLMLGVLTSIAGFVIVALKEMGL